MLLRVGAAGLMVEETHFGCLIAGEALPNDVYHVRACPVIRASRELEQE